MSSNFQNIVYSVLLPTTRIRILPAAGTGVKAFSGVVGEAARGMDWLRGAPEAVFEVVENENIGEVH